MQTQNYYANFPSKLYQMEFKSVRDRTYHLAAMALVMGYVHTGDGYFYMSASRLAKEIGCSKAKAVEIIKNFIHWGFWIIIEKAKNQHSDSIYKLSTYDWDTVLEEEKYESNDVDLGADLRPAKRPAKYTSTSKEYQGSEQNLQPAARPAKRPQTNNELTNNEITNNEIKTNNEEKEKSESFNEDFRNEDFRLEQENEIKHLLTESEQEDVSPTEKELSRELQKLLGVYPKKTANFRRLRERYWELRLKHKLPYEHVYEAVNNYILEMKSQEIDEKYWKNLDTLLDFVEIEPFLFKPVIAIDKKGKRFRGEFCIATGCLRYRVNESRIESQHIDSKKFQRMVDENRLIFLNKQQQELANAA